MNRFAKTLRMCLRDGQLPDHVSWTDIEALRQGMTDDERCAFDRREPRCTVRRGGTLYVLTDLRGRLTWRGRALLKAKSTNTEET